jgi:hypothetical protein
MTRITAWIFVCLIVACGGEPFRLTQALDSTAGSSSAGAENKRPTGSAGSGGESDRASATGGAQSQGGVAGSAGSAGSADIGGSAGSAGVPWSGIGGALPIGGAGGIEGDGAAGGGGVPGPGYLECKMRVSSASICAQTPGCVDGLILCADWSQGEYTCDEAATCVRCPNRGSYNCDGTSENGCETPGSWDNCGGCGRSCQSQYQQCKCTSAGCACVFD